MSCRDAALGRPLVLDGVPGLRLVSDVTGRAGLPAADQENEDVVQAPPAQNHEVLLQHQPEPRRQGLEATRSEDRPIKESFTGETFIQML